MIPDGVRALSILAKEHIRVNMTLIFSAPQALIVAKAGAYIVSPFLGRLDDISSDGLTLLRESWTFTRPIIFGRKSWPRACATRCTS